jgi:hypothetical protein
MPDELDTQLLRWFGDSRQALVDAQFVARVSAQLRGPRGAHVRFGAPGSIVATILSGLVTGIAAPLRLRHAGLMTLAAAVVTLWTALQSL